MSRTEFGGLPPAELWVPCGERQHLLRWAAGRLTPMDHPDAERERTLIALGGDAYRCLEITDLWARHDDDLDVLMVASRGPADPLLPPAMDDADGVHQHGGYQGMSGHFSSLNHLGRRHTRFGGSAGHGWYGAPERYEDAGGDGGDLLGLGAGLPERLVAGVITAWCDRIDDVDERVTAATPALHAALYGRLLAALQGWLGAGRLTLALQMVDSAAPPRLAVHADTVTAELPFAWLRDVWLRGLVTVLGRFTLAAAQSTEQMWTLRTVLRDASEPRTMTIEL